MIQVQYISSGNQSFILHGDRTAWMDLNVFRSYAWDYTTVTRPSGSGGIVTSFSRAPTGKTLKVSVTARNRAELASWANSLQAATEPDIERATPGRIYVGKQYVTAYITALNVAEYIKAAHLAIIELTAVVTEPYWCTESSKIFRRADEAANPGGKKYPLRYPYKYLTGVGNSSLINAHYSASPMRITVYGPASNPLINIAGNTYNVSETIPAGSRLVIDQATHTIKIIASDGSEANVFNSRNKSHDIFAPLPTGESPVTFSGDFEFEVTIIKRRTGLEWI